MRTCPLCQARPVKMAWAPYCYQCQPGGPFTPPPCRKCGSAQDYYTAGLCIRCHRLSPHRMDSCTDCYAWGATRHEGWLCQGCRAWRRKYASVAACSRCGRTVALDSGGRCRLCSKQSCLQPAGQRRDQLPAFTGGHQLFLADMFHFPTPTSPAGLPRFDLRRVTTAPTGPRRRGPLQLVLFDVLAPAKTLIRPRACARCARRPAIKASVSYCHDCAPEGPRIPPPCRRCGSLTDYYSAGLCVLCHRASPVVISSCPDCLAWGTRRVNGWRCDGCRGWRRHHLVQDCICCGRNLPVAAHGACRLCYLQAVRTLGRPTTALVLAANRTGQQLCLADLLVRRPPRKVPHPHDLYPGAGSQPDAETATRPGNAERHTAERLPADQQARREYPVPYRQLALLDIERDLAAGQRAGFPDPPDPGLARLLDEHLDHHGATHGWGNNLTARTRQGIRVLLTLQDSPGAPIPASAVAALKALRLPVYQTSAVLNAAGMLHDDRVSSLPAWFDRQTSGLPAPMLGELRIWFDLVSLGSQTPPRIRPRNRKNVQSNLRHAMPAMHAWAGQGHTSLREISRDDVLASLPQATTARTSCCVGLRSIFRILKARKVIFADPTIRIKVGSYPANTPMPADLTLIRALLNSPDPTTAAMAALVAYHALTPAQLARLHLSDLHDARLHLRARVVLLADPARERLASYLDHRAHRWPGTCNPHLFLNDRQAPRTSPVAADWTSKRLEGQARAIREDRILDEVHATAGDARRIQDLFGLQPDSRSRYLATLAHPDLDDH